MFEGIVLKAQEPLGILSSELDPTGDHISADSMRSGGCIQQKQLHCQSLLKKNQWVRDVSSIHGPSTDLKDFNLEDTSGKPAAPQNIGLGGL